MRAILNTLNKERIRAALVAYEEMKCQCEAAEKGMDVLALEKAGKDDEADALLDARYPNADYVTLLDLGVDLVEATTKGLPIWKGIKPETVYLDGRAFADMLRLARTVVRGRGE